MNKLEEILDSIQELGLEVSSEVLTTEEAAELLVYGFVVE